MHPPHSKSEIKLLKQGTGVKMDQTYTQKTKSANLETQLNNKK